MLLTRTRFIAGRYLGRTVLGLAAMLLLAQPGAGRNDPFSGDKGWASVGTSVQALPLPPRVGQIFIVGNYSTPDCIILALVPFYPGGLLSHADLRQGERNLARLGLFLVDPRAGIRPIVTVLDNPANPDSEFQDVQITVQEAPGTDLMCKGIRLAGTWRAKGLAAALAEVGVEVLDAMSLCKEANGDSNEPVSTDW